MMPGAPYGNRTRVSALRGLRRGAQGGHLIIGSFHHCKTANWSTNLHWLPRVARSRIVGGEVGKMLVGVVRRLIVVVWLRRLAVLLSVLFQRLVPKLGQVLALTRCL
jgi:hypothetical protein